MKKIVLLSMFSFVLQHSFAQLTPPGVDSLRISLLYFKGTQSGNNHLLNWKVNCLSNKVKFEIENSADGIHFFSAGKIEATQARCAQPFDFTNDKSLPGINYYRIKIVDIDGKFYYSTIVSLIKKTKGYQLINLTPNLVRTEDAILKINAGQSENINITISDMMGKTISRQDVQLAAGINEVMINAKYLSTGMYQVTGFTKSDKSQTLRFLKQ